MELSLIDRIDICLVKSSKFEIYHSVESYNKKTAENLRTFNDAKKLIVSKLYNISIPNLISIILSL